MTTGPILVDDLGSSVGNSVTIISLIVSGGLLGGTNPSRFTCTVKLAREAGELTRLVETALPFKLARASIAAVEQNGRFNGVNIDIIGNPPHVLVRAHSLSLGATLETIIDALVVFLALLSIHTGAIACTFVVALLLLLLLLCFRGGGRAEVEVLAAGDGQCFTLGLMLSVILILIDAAVAAAATPHGWRGFCSC